MARKATAEEIDCQHFRLEELEGDWIRPRRTPNAFIPLLARKKRKHAGASVTEDDLISTGRLALRQWMAANPEYAPHSLPSIVLGVIKKAVNAEVKASRGEYGCSGSTLDSLDYQRQLPLDAESEQWLRETEKAIRTQIGDDSWECLLLLKGSNWPVEDIASHRKETSELVRERLSAALVALREFGPPLWTSIQTRAVAQGIRCDDPYPFGVSPV